MAERLTTAQVDDQMKRFDELLKKCNLVKLGCMLVKKNWHVERNFLNRYLRMNEIGGCYYHPMKMLFYNDLLRHEAVVAYVESLQPENQPDYVQKSIRENLER